MFEKAIKIYKRPALTEQIRISSPVEKDMTRRTGVGLTWTAKKKKKSEHIEIDEYNSSLKWVVHATSEQTVYKCAMAIIAQPCNIRVFTGSSTCFLMTQPSSFICSDCRIKTDLLFHDKVTSLWNFPICIFIATSWYSFVSISRQSCVYWHGLAAQRWSFSDAYVCQSIGERPQCLLCAKRYAPHLMGVWNVFLCSQRDKAWTKTRPTPQTLL